MQNELNKILLRWLIGLVIPIALIVSGIGIIWGMGSSKVAKNVDDGTDLISQLRRMPIVKVDRILEYPDEIPLDIEVNGVVVPFREVTLAAEVAGRVSYKSPNCKIGRYVEEGELLFSIDKTDYEWEVERLTAQRDSEKAQQQELDQDVANVKRMIELADEELAIQNREVARLEELPQGFASATELDQARRARLVAQNARVNLLNQLDLLSTRRNRVMQAERLATALLEQAKVNLARTEIRAPSSGVIASESVEADSFVQKGATLCVIEDTQHVEISTNLRADQMFYILNQRDAYPPQDEGKRQGYELPPTEVTVSYWLSGRRNEVYEWKGHLSRYEGIGMNPQSRTVPVRILVDNPMDMRRRGSESEMAMTGAPTALVRGMFVECAIHTKPKRRMLLVPKIAIRPGGQLWLFEPQPSFFPANSIKESVDSPAVDDGALPYAPDEASKTDATALQPDAWAVGGLKVVSGLQLVRTFKLAQSRYSDYWVIEAHEELNPQDLVIVTPLATILGGGQDFVRYPKEDRK